MQYVLDTNVPVKCQKYENVLKSLKRCLKVWKCVHICEKAWTYTNVNTFSNICTHFPNISKTFRHFHKHLRLFILLINFHTFSHLSKFFHNIPFSHLSHFNKFANFYTLFTKFHILPHINFFAYFNIVSHVFRHFGTFHFFQILHKHFQI